MMNNAYNNLNSLINQFTKAAAAAQKVIMLSDTLPDVVTKHTINTDESINLRGEIDVNNVSFCYQMRPEHLVLKDVNLHIPPATTCAFVGRSGGGKSTLVHLLLRFYDTTSGSIEYDGVSIDEWNLKLLRKQMAVVAQDSQLFATSIIENITYGMKPHEYTREEVISAAKAANAYDFIMDMEEGFDTRVGERGQRISGGQRQRIAICRAFMRKPKVLLLDEATSALDAESESLVQSAIDNLIKLTHCTVLLVAHRLSTVMNADQICVLDGGTIIERGTHDQLLEHGGLYYELVKRQLARKANLLEDGEEGEEGTTEGGKKAVDTIDVLIEQAAKQRMGKMKEEKKEP
jgi:ABC-type multidrug transport system fused ATPase/permease subunit